MKQFLLRADELIRAELFAEALDALNEVEAAALSPEGCAYRHLLLAEARFGLGQYDHGPLDRAIEYYRGSASHENFARAKYLKGRALCADGMYRAAKEPLLEAYAASLRLRDDRGATRALNSLAYVELQLGDYRAAIDNLRQCCFAAAASDDSWRVTQLAHNLASLLCICGDLAESLKTYEEHPVPDAPAADKTRAIYHFMSAVPLALLGRYDDARARIAGAEPLVDRYPHEKAIYFENMGLICLLSGDYAGAERALESGLALSLQIAPDSALVPQIKRLQGDLYVATERWDLAGESALGALEAAERTGKRLEIAACWRVMAQVENHAGDHEAARKWFEKAIDLLGMIGARYELAVTRYLAGVSDLYRNGERLALLHLARRYFESEHVEPYLAKTAEALRNGPSPVRPVSADSAPPVVHRSAVMKDLVTLCEDVAQSDMTVLLTGETGTGKDLLARYIHCHSGRKGEFVTINAAAMPYELVESELFGYGKGSFTGADGDRPGLLEQAEGGTFYLNEIGDAPLGFQAKLLEVLETRRIRRLGENHSRTLSFRLIAATNHDLAAAVRENRFRADLYYRLNQIPLHLPPLRERSADIPLLASHFLSLEGVTSDANNGSYGRFAAALAQRRWPGNVRQLQSEISRLRLSAGGNLERMAALAELAAEQSERDDLLMVLSQCGWNRREAARLLGVNESTVRYRIRRHGIAEPLQQR